jgi:hypothetical protein
VRRPLLTTPVRLEGYFFLRYTVFDVFGIKPGNTQAPVLASATSTRFEVYSSKAFPGLQVTTLPGLPVTPS